MRTIKLIIAYDGTDFLGWQRQDGQSSRLKESARLKESLRLEKARTVQGIIEAALEKMHGHPVALAGAGRTDSGVHARAQAASFQTDIESIKPDRFVPALNSLLPSDVRIMEAGEAAPDFHARFSARMRTYRYFFITGRQAMPHENRYALQLWRVPRIDILNSYCRLLPGERDCAIFASRGGGAGSGDTSKSTFRNITHAAFLAEGGRLVFEISANAFLMKMVRSAAGTFLHYEERDTPSAQLGDIIASGDRSLAGPTLPPQGLFLWKVDY
jgi:tRNA pseudouridine38-40 synthase